MGQQNKARIDDRVRSDPARLGDTAGPKVGIVHYGEHTPLDDHYRAARMGQLAGWLVEAGYEVVRFTPTYSPFTGAQRPEDWSGTSTEEGIIHMIPTRSYETSVSRDRFGFLVDFARGVATRAAELAPFDAMIVGYPPPGVVSRLRAVLGSRTPILADIRDLWPDALVPSHRSTVHRAAQVAGHALATELRRADGVVAMSDTMLDRAPRSVRLQAISHAIPASLGDTPIPAGATGGLRAVFVGTFTQGVDLPALFGGWRTFVSERANDRRSPTLVVCGDGERAAEVQALTVDVPGVQLLGRVAAPEVRERLVEADIGVVATRPGFGTTFSNKVIEYIGMGLYVVNSLEAESAARLDELGLGHRIPSTAPGWAGGFADAERRLDELRAQRGERRTIALETYGRSAIEPQWLAALNRIGLSSSASRN